MNFEPIWIRIAANAGGVFHQKTGKAFTYTIEGNAVRPSTTNRLLARAQFEKAYDRFPVPGPGSLQDLQGPSYLWAILTDRRISSGADG